MEMDLVCLEMRTGQSNARKTWCAFFETSSYLNTPISRSPLCSRISAYSKGPALNEYLDKHCRPRMPHKPGWLSFKVAYQKHYLAGPVDPMPLIRDLEAKAVMRRSSATKTIVGIGGR